MVKSYLDAQASDFQVLLLAHCHVTSSHWVSERRIYQCDELHFCFSYYHLQKKALLKPTTYPHNNCIYGRKQAEDTTTHKINKQI